MKSLAIALVVITVIGAVVYLLVKMLGAMNQKAPVVVAQNPTKQTSAQKAQEWIGVSGSAVDAFKSFASLFGNGKLAASAT